MGNNKQKDVEKVKKENIFTKFINYIFKEKPWVGSIAVFFITIVANIISAISGDSISYLKLLAITLLVTLIIFICLSPVLIMHLVKGLRHIIVDEEIVEKNVNLSDNLYKLIDILQKSNERFDESINRNEKYIKSTVNHMDDFWKINNIVKKSYMISDVDEYYQHLKKGERKCG